MGISLSYWASDRVPDNVAKAIKDDAKRINAFHDWWCEPIMFFDWPEKHTNLAGDSKVEYARGYSPSKGNYVEVDFDDNQFMGCRDAQFIVEQLCEWSRRYQVTWQLDYGGNDLGQIKGGETNELFDQFLVE